MVSQGNERLLNILFDLWMALVGFLMFRYPELNKTMRWMRVVTSKYVWLIRLLGLLAMVLFVFSAIHDLAPGFGW